MDNCKYINIAKDSMKFYSYKNTAENFITTVIKIQEKTLILKRS